MSQGTELNNVPTLLMPVCPQLICAFVSPECVSMCHGFLWKAHWGVYGPWSLSKGKPASLFLLWGRALITATARCSLLSQSFCDALQGDPSQWTIQWPASSVRFVWETLALQLSHHSKHLDKMHPEEALCYEGNTYGSFLWFQTQWTALKMYLLHSFKKQRAK